ncbi:MAG: hypothetical protein JNM66_01810 [Bryobacterales bacterium]|nr:hypothetical protein [Bryobacterales bacterium]
MIEPRLSLAMSMQASPGVYALLLGSGVSRAASIPTGWEVQLDLIRRLASASGVSADPDPEAWYRKEFQQSPNYSNLLGAVAKSSAERMQLLRSYFEPKPEEREQGLKLPTAAHRAIAKLVADGFVRVILTTNFDRLIESALTEIGIQPMVVSTPDAAVGALLLGSFEMHGCEDQRGLPGHAAKEHRGGAIVV